MTDIIATKLIRKDVYSWIPNSSMSGIRFGESLTDLLETKRIFSLELSDKVLYEAIIENDDIWDHYVLSDDSNIHILICDGIVDGIETDLCCYYNEFNIINLAIDEFVSIFPDIEFVVDPAYSLNIDDELAIYFVDYHFEKIGCTLTTVDGVIKSVLTYSQLQWN